MHATSEKYEAQYDLRELDPDREPWIFEKLRHGLQNDGTELADLGGAWFALFERFGIEDIVGVGGFESESHFFEWVRAKIDLELSDWKPIKLTLNQCWFELSDEIEGDQCYLSWRSNPGTDALKVTPRDVFALQHVAFNADDAKSFAIFTSARLRSGANEASMSDNHKALAPSD